jgi:anti-sigma regulatory factor (Ser/Thr protein kinase)
MGTTEQIRDFLLSQVKTHPKDLVRLTASTFSISRQAVNRHLRKLIDQGAITATGTTKSRHYELALIEQLRFTLPITPKLEEHEVWRTALLPRLGSAADNAIRICEYAFTEMLNNVIDHSAGTSVAITLEVSPLSILIQVDDNGVGVFNKIQAALGLVDQRHAILELVKGKVTTDPKRHSGEGIFFTSRAVEQFSLLSGSLYFGHLRDTEDWLIEDAEMESPGTLVRLLVDPHTKRTLSAVFSKYASAEDDFGFTRTVVPVSLLQYGVEKLVSRSQAKRLLARFDRFKEVVLDFKGVESLGQGFADEVFRVYANAFPDVNIRWMNANVDVERMILRALANVDEDQLRLFSAPDPVPSLLPSDIPDNSGS